MTSIVWDNQGVIMVEYLEDGRMINGAYYAEEKTMTGTALEKVHRKGDYIEK